MEGKKRELEDFINNSTKITQALADVNMIIGEPIITISGFQIIPFSKITLGNLTGEGEYGAIKVVKENNGYPIIGGGGAVVSMKPMGFLVDDGTTCRVIRITDEPIDNLLEKASEIMQDIIAKK